MKRSGSQITDFVFVAAGTGSHLAGGDMIAVEAAKVLIRSGHRLVIVTSREGRLTWERAGVPGEYWTFDPRIHPGGNLMGDALRLSELMARAIGCTTRKHVRKSTVVFAASDMLLDVLPGVFLRGPGVRRIALFHMVIPSPFGGYRGAFGNGRRRFRLDMRAGLNYAQQSLSILCLRRWYDLIMTQSPHNRRFLEGKFPSRQIAPFDLPYGIDWELVTGSAESEKTFDACWMGRSHPQKGLPDLLNVWDLVRREKPDAQLALIGDVVGPVAPLVNELDLRNNVSCLGYLDGKEKFSILQQSKLFVFPSYFEGKPVAVAEAFACGLPVVAYDLPVYRGVYSRGLLTSPIGDTKGMAAQIVRLLSDENHRQELSGEARASVVDHTWEASAESLLRGARLVLDRPGRSADR